MPQYESNLDSDALSGILDKWAQPPSSAVSQLPRGNVQLDYLDHAQTTRALIEIDPLWTYEFRAVADDGLPRVRQVGERLYLGITLWLCGKPLPGIGSALVTSPDPLKELIGDALRNAAMRFGIALSLWSKLEMPTTEPQSLPPEAALPASEPSEGTDTAEQGSASVEGVRELLRARIDTLPPGARGTLKASMIFQGLSLARAPDLETLEKIDILVRASELAEEGNQKRDAQVAEELALLETSEYDAR